MGYITFSPRHYVEHFQQYHQEKRMAETSSTTAGAQTLLRGLAVLNAVYNGCHDLKVSASSPARPGAQPIV